MKNPSPAFHVRLIAAPYGGARMATGPPSRVPARIPHTDPQSSPEVIEMSSHQSPTAAARRVPAASRTPDTPSAGRRVLLALPVAALLVTAGCSSDSGDQTAESPAAEQSTVTETATAAPATSPTGQQAGETDAAREADGGFDPANCDTDRVGQDITGDVHVRSGQTCLLTDLTVTGEIDVHEGGRLEVRNVRVTEDIDAEQHAYLLVSGGEVTGSIELERGGEAVVENVRIGGSLDSEENTGPQRFEGNTIGGDLECENNTQNPTGGGNQVSGQREGQCSGL